MGGFLGSVTSFGVWAKLFYTGLLLLLATALLRESWRLWFDRTVAIGQFTSQADGAAIQVDDAFTRRVLQTHALFKQRLAEEPERRRRLELANRLLADIAVMPIDVPPVQDSRSLLSDVQASVQGVNIGAILQSLRNWVSPPNEITGHLAQVNGAVRLMASWPEPLRLPSGTLAVDQIHISGQGDPGEVSIGLVCRIVYAQTRKSGSQGSDVPYPDVSEEVFCTWARLWWELRNIVDRNDPLSAAGYAAQVAPLRQQLDAIIAQGTKFPEFYLMRAEIIELAPTDQKKAGDIALAAQDLTRYTGLLPKSVIESARNQQAEAPAPPQAAAPVPESAVDYQPPPSLGVAEIGPGRNARVTMTALVQDARGKRFVVLPDYAWVERPGAGGSVPGVEIFQPGRKEPIGRIVGRIADKGPGIVLAEVLAADLKGGPERFALADPAAGDMVGVQVAEAPGMPGEIRMARLSEVAVDIGGKSSGSGKFLAADKITRPGDGGAPVLNEAGEVVAMAYASSDRQSYFLPIVRMLMDAGYRAVPAGQGAKKAGGAP
ncbi:hypothetical protein JL100_002360 [Skermanella mucosa]|uniref:hypothetical protein n=1 Tax=Skermanella mucosa TaxID=1789672 RepID=UPI00192BE370|nr:hypothetical protein [Skermanella mucosa]UEM21636.1 hypothetical protein JL100_002360 [Skermanella mucosa]